MSLRPLREAARQLYQRRDDLQAAFPNSDSPEYWAWCHSYGVFEDPEIARLAPPLPPEDLRALIGAGSGAQRFLTTGATLFLAVADVGNLSTSRAILDFGCGCGRLLRFLSFYAQQAEIVGVDVEPRHIQWASCNLNFGLFTLTEGVPPLPFLCGRFDTILSLSVFSHLPAHAHQAWMEELARVVSEDGRIIITTLGATAIETALADPASFRQLDIPEPEFHRAREDFLAAGFSFVLQRAHPLADYGIAFASDSWIRNSWATYFETVAYMPGWLGAWQDGYLLRRRSSPPVRL